MIITCFPYCAKLAQIL
ncbi:hypothetical protein CAEBREN_05390 [Caenorhabditis brenneri]|uniref:Uncharacterized protein n=1 Tax=Caenorhabditis brenneri TaxID=135651 RepID=G0MJU5_CAEBE|nr:hypothetical protein CAEBREN_05390 [Caenorhabditis brenneri]